MATKYFKWLSLSLILCCFATGYGQLVVKNVLTQRLLASKDVQKALRASFASFNWKQYRGDIDVGPTQNMSSCINSTLSVLNSTQGEIQYLDAAGKPPSGIFLGNTAWLGSFDSCQDIAQAHYCLTYFNVSLHLGNKTVPLSIKWGSCLPKSCNAVDLGNAIKYILSEVPSINSSVGYQQSVCPVKPKYTTSVVLTLIFCGLLLLLCLLGSIVDVLKGKSHDKSVLKQIETPCYSVQENSEHQQSSPDRSAVFSCHEYTDPCMPLVPEPGKTTPMVQIKKATGFLDFLVCFSLVRNTARIFSTTVPPVAITSVNGVRVMSMFWIILGHTFLFLVGSYLTENAVDMLNDTKKLFMMVIINAYFSVDAFFFLSGLLVAYTGFRKLEKSEGRINWILFYVHRYLRVTPSYMFVILFYDRLLPFLVYSPLWTVNKDELCSKYWWTNLLYINNFYPDDFMKQCIGWSWYLANDMQFYIITPLLLVLAYRFNWSGLLASAGSLLLASTITIACVIGFYDIDPIALGKFRGEHLFGDPDQTDFLNKVYDKPYGRIQPYLVGFMLGYFMHKSYSGTRKPGWIFATASWIVAIVVGITLVYGPHEDTLPDGRDWTTAENVVYGTLERLLWGLALAWVTYACHYGYGGLIQKFLSAKFWIPLSRLTYSAYLVHPIVLTFMFKGSKTPIFYSLTTISYYFIAAVVLAYGAGFILAVVIEFPCDNLENMAFKSSRKKSQ